MVDLDKLEELAKAAIPGPWRKTIGDGNEMRFVSIEDANGDAVFCTDDFLEECGWTASHKSLDFIAAANPAAVLELIAALTSAKAEIERLKEALRPKYAYDPACWETTVPAEELDLLFDDTGEKGPFPLVLLAELPKQWAVRVANEEFWTSDFITFPTEDEAQQYLRAAAAAMGEEPRT